MSAVVRTPKRRDIQQLRGLAVLAVSLEHCGYVFARGGFIGVDIFFVISGYLILGKLNDEYQRTGKVRFGAFWSRRILRLAPGAAVTLAATGLFVWLAKIDYFTFTRALKDAAWASASMLNIEYLIDGNSYWSDAVTSPLIHFWSLGVEEQFYVAASVGFLLLGIITRHRPKPIRPIYVFFAVVTLIALYFEMQANTVAAFYNPIGRGWEFALGGLVAASRPRPGGRLTKMLSSRVAKFLSWGGLLTAIALITPDMVWPGPLTIVVAILTCGVLYRDRPHDQPRNWVPTLTAPLSKFMTWVGDVSYSLYLWHWPVLVLGGWALTGTMQDPRSADALRNLLLLELAMVFAAISERFIERPIISRGRLPRAGRLATVFFLVCYANGTLTFAQLYKLPPVFSASSKDIVKVPTDNTASPVRTFSAAEIEAAAITGTDDTFKAECAAHFEVKAVPGNWVTNCTMGDTSAPKTVAVLGDSHAHQWLPALNALGAKHHFKVIAYTKSSCPFITLTAKHPRANRGYTECDAWNSSVIKKLKSDPSIDGIIIGRSGAYQLDGDLTKGWRLGTRATLVKLSSITTNIVMLGDNPLSSNRMTSCVLSNINNPSRCNIPILQGVQPDDRLLSYEKPAARQAGLPSSVFVSTRDFLCEPQVCNAITPEGHVLLRMGNHITAGAALEMADRLWARIESPLGLTPKPTVSATPTASTSPGTRKAKSRRKASPSASPTASASPSS